MLLAIAGPEQQSVRGSRLCYEDSTAVIFKWLLAVILTSHWSHVCLLNCD